MSIVFILFLGQCVFAVVAVLVLKKLLDKELMTSALEKFESCKISAEIKAIAVRSAAGVGREFIEHLEYLKRRKCPQAILNFEKDAALKGGVVIVAGEHLLDFSLSSRLQHMWS